MTALLAPMVAAVVQWSKDKGWYEDPRSFMACMALLHSEVSEALEAWREWGLDDATAPGTWALADDLDRATPAAVVPPKPEGVGSEFADIAIRLFDDCARYAVDLDAALGEVGNYVVPDTVDFPDAMASLHVIIARMTVRCFGIDTDPDKRDVKAFALVYRALEGCCVRYGVNLEAEIRRKMTYNQTRPYKHGGKRI